MKKKRTIYIKLLVFLLPVLAFWGYAEVTLTRMPNSFNLKKKYFDKKADSIEVLILGASHAYHGIDPDYLSYKCFNLSNNDQSIDYDMAITTMYLNKMPKLKLVVCNIDYFTLYYTLANSVDKWREDYYYRYWGLKYNGWSVLNPKNYSMIMLSTPKIAQAMFFTDMSNFMTKNIEPNGYEKLDTLNNDGLDTVQGKPRAELHNSWIRNSPPGTSDTILKRLESFMSLLKSNNIKLAFVYTPEYICYSKYCDIAAKKQTDNIIHNLCSKYGDTCFNYINDERFGKADFHDNDHLNIKGAIKFSKIINKDICIPLVQ